MREVINTMIEHIHSIAGLLCEKVPDATANKLGMKMRESSICISGAKGKISKKSVRVLIKDVILPVVPSRGTLLS